MTGILGHVTHPAATWRLLVCSSGLVGRLKVTGAHTWHRSRDATRNEILRELLRWKDVDDAMTGVTANHLDITWSILEANFVLWEIDDGPKTVKKSYRKEMRYGLLQNLGLDETQSPANLHGKKHVASGLGRSANSLGRGRALGEDRRLPSDLAQSFLIIIEGTDSDEILPGADVQYGLSGS